MHPLAQAGPWTALIAALLLAVGALVWLLGHHRPTAEEIERERRLRLVSYGRLVDGILLDLIESDHIEAASIAATGSTARLMLLYQYEIAGVNYECAQDISALRDMLPPGQVQVGLPCSVRYQPGSPENSIVLAETWSGLRSPTVSRPAQPQSPFQRRRSHLSRPRPTRALG